MSSKKKAIQQRILESAQIPGGSLQRSRSSSDNRKRRGIHREFQGILEYTDCGILILGKQGRILIEGRYLQDSVLYLRRDENYRTDRPDPLIYKEAKLGFEASFIPKRDAEDKRNR